MKLKIAFDPDLVALMQAEIAAGEKAVSAAMREVGTSLKSAWRGQITGAGLGTHPRHGRHTRFDQLGAFAQEIVVVMVVVLLPARDRDCMKRNSERQ